MTDHLSIVAKISRSYGTRPSASFDALMEALDGYLHAHEGDGSTWESFDQLIVALSHACRFGDSTCPCGSDTLNWPHRLQESAGGWLAQYSCRECGTLYDCWWSDEI